MDYKLFKNAKTDLKKLLSMTEEEAIEEFKVDNREEAIEYIIDHLYTEL